VVDDDRTGAKVAMLPASFSVTVLLDHHRETLAGVRPEALARIETLVKMETSLIRSLAIPRLSSSAFSRTVSKTGTGVSLPEAAGRLKVVTGLLGHPVDKIEMLRFSSLTLSLKLPGAEPSKTDVFAVWGGVAGGGIRVSVASDPEEYVSDLCEAVLLATKRAGDRRAMKVLNLLRYLEQGPRFAKFMKRDFPREASTRPEVDTERLLREREEQEMTRAREECKRTEEEKERQEEARNEAARRRASEEKERQTQEAAERVRERETLQETENEAQQHRGDDAKRHAKLKEKAEAVDKQRDNAATEAKIKREAAAKIKSKAARRKGEEAAEELLQEQAGMDAVFQAGGGPPPPPPPPIIPEPGEMSSRPLPAASLDPAAVATPTRRCAPLSLRPLCTMNIPLTSEQQDSSCPHQQTHRIPPLGQVLS